MRKQIIFDVQMVNVYHILSDATVVQIVPIKVTKSCVVHNAIMQFKSLISYMICYNTRPRFVKLYIIITLLCVHILIFTHTFIICLQFFFLNFYFRAKNGQSGHATDAKTPWALWAARQASRPVYSLRGCGCCLGCTRAYSALINLLSSSFCTDFDFIARTA